MASDGHYSLGKYSCHIISEAYVKKVRLNEIKYIYHNARCDNHTCGIVMPRANKWQLHAHGHCSPDRIYRYRCYDILIIIDLFEVIWLELYMCVLDISCFLVNRCRITLMDSYLYWSCCNQDMNHFRLSSICFQNFSNNQNCISWFQNLHY